MRNRPYLLLVLLLVAAGVLWLLVVPWLACLCLPLYDDYLEWVTRMTRGD